MLVVLDPGVTGTQDMNLEPPEDLPEEYYEALMEEADEHGKLQLSLEHMRAKIHSPDEQWPGEIDLRSCQPLSKLEALVQYQESTGLLFTLLNSDVFSLTTLTNEDVFFRHFRKFWWWFEFEALITGSIADGLRVPALSRPNLYTTLRSVQPEADYLIILKNMIITDPEWLVEWRMPGYIQIQLPGSIEKIWEEQGYVVEREYSSGVHRFLSAQQLRKDFAYQVSYRIAQDTNLRIYGSCRLGCENAEVREVEAHGPAIYVKYDLEDTHVDYVLALECSFWPTCAEDWPNRSRNWPPQRDVDIIFNNGCHLVPKQPPAVFQPSDYEIETVWRVSFSVAESILFFKMEKDMQILKKCLKILKMLHGFHFASPNIITTYHLKTLTLWAAERFPLNTFTETNVAHIVLALLDDLLHCLATKKLPHYFISSVNLLEGIPDEFVVEIAAKVSMVRSNPLTYLSFEVENGTPGMIFLDRIG